MLSSERTLLGVLPQDPLLFDNTRDNLQYIKDWGQNTPEMGRILSTELMEIIIKLSEIDYKSEGWNQNDLPVWISTSSSINRANIRTVGDVFEWAKYVVKKALWVVSQLMDPKAWGKVENYLEFFLTMLISEEKMVEKILSMYSNYKLPVQISHYMMDMQLAYKYEKPPYYQFFTKQLERMQKVQENFDGQLIGFSAFDPRRKNWLEIAENSLKNGFIGFKFYPAMGYKPSGNPDEIQSVVNDFFDFCLEKDVPIFVHCTPIGFQTKEKLGYYAHPKFWRVVLKDERWKNLRLCLGHAGGGKASNGSLLSAGWMADSDREWEDEDNFAGIVVELCKNFSNVYCEIANIIDLLDKEGQEKFLKNVERARKIPGKFEFLDKVSYGSDWHMPDMVNNASEYVGVFLKIFNQQPYKAYLDKFFWENSYQYLKKGLVE